MKFLEMVQRTIRIWLAKFHWNRFVHYSTLKNKDDLKDAIKKLHENLGESK